MAGVFDLLRFEKNSGSDLRSMGWMVERENHDEYEGMTSGCVWLAR